MGKKSKGKGKDRKKARSRPWPDIVGPAAPFLDDGASDAAAASAGRQGLPAHAVPRPGRQGGGSPATAGRQVVGAVELAARLAGLSTVLQRHLARADAGEGLTRARLSALGLLVMGGPRTLGELAAAEQVRPPTMTRLVHAMEADGLVSRQPNPADGRSVVIRATPLGEQQLQHGRRRQVAPLAESISDLDRAERVQLELATDLLGRLLRSSSWGPAETTE